MFGLDAFHLLLAVGGAAVGWWLQRRGGSPVGPTPTPSAPSTNDLGAKLLALIKLLAERQQGAQAMADLSALLHHAPSTMRPPAPAAPNQPEAK